MHLQNMHVVCMLKIISSKTLRHIAIYQGLLDLQIQV